MPNDVKTIIKEKTGDVLSIWHVTGAAYAATLDKSGKIWKSISTI